MTLKACPMHLDSGISMAQDSRGETILREYKGHLIALTADQQQDGQWMCRYLILYSDVTGSCDGIFATHDEAEAAALQLAKYLIDSHQCG